MISLLVATFFFGCAFPPPDCASGYHRDSHGQCQPIEDDADTGGGTLITEPLSGGIEIVVDAETGGIELADTCVGEVGLDVTDSAIQGVVSCSFVGAIGETLGGEIFEGTLTGTLDESGGAAGGMVLELGIFGILDAQWSGTGSNSLVQGSFVGDMTVVLPGGALEAEVAYSGSFEAAER